jgi:hypothetical protein
LVIQMLRGEVHVGAPDSVRDHMCVDDHVNDCLLVIKSAKATGQRALRSRIRVRFPHPDGETLSLTYRFSSSCNWLSRRGCAHAYKLGACY